MMAKLVNVIRLNGGRVSDEEVLEVYRFENERINLNFIKVAPGSFRNQVSANEVEERDYYQKHLEDFRVPTQVQVQYLVFRPSDFEGKVQVTPTSCSEPMISRRRGLRPRNASRRERS